MPRWILKLAVIVARDPQKTSKALVYVVGCIIGGMVLIGTLSMDMISSFLGQEDQSGSDIINQDYDVESTKLYQQIKGVYDKYCADMIAAMDKREQEIRDENTTYRDVTTVDENGKETTTKVAVCDVTVIKTWNDFSLSYLYAYINHSSDVKGGQKYKFNKKDIYKVCSKICSLQEIKSVNKTYILYTSVITPQDAAKLLFDQDDDQQMFLVSYDLYDDFLMFTSNTYASAGSGIVTDGSGTNESSTDTGTKATGSASQKLAALFPDGVPQTEAEMQKYLTTVQITVRDKDGNLQTRSLSVHKALADDVVAIFQEIADAGFCAYDVGSYSWRQMAASGNRSHHSYGVAIDINPNENYMVKAGKVVAGSCWDPTNNQYSFGPNSVVVQAFQKRGWVWGGSWKSSKDYMHFSYTGY